MYADSVKCFEVIKTRLINPIARFESRSGQILEWDILSVCRPLVGGFFSRCTVYLHHLRTDRIKIYLKAKESWLGRLLEVFPDNFRLVFFWFFIQWWIFRRNLQKSSFMYSTRTFITLKQQQLKEPKLRYSYFLPGLNIYTTRQFGMYIKRGS